MGGKGKGDLPPHKSKNLFNLTLNFRCLPAANRLFEKLQAVTKPNPWKTSSFAGVGGGVVMLIKTYSKAIPSLISLMVSVDVKHHKGRSHGWPKSPVLGINGHGQFGSVLFTRKNCYDDVTLQAKIRSAVKMRNPSTVTPLSSSYVLNIMLFFYYYKTACCAAWWIDTW